MGALNVIFIQSECTAPAALYPTGQRFAPASVARQRMFRFARAGGDYQTTRSLIMVTSDIKNIKDLEDEKRRIKQMISDLSLETMHSNMLSKFTISLNNKRIGYRFRQPDPIICLIKFNALLKHYPGIYFQDNGFTMPFPDAVCCRFIRR